MTCKICGKKLPDGSTVCKYCGTELRRPQPNSKRYSRKGKARKRAVDAIVLLLALLVIAGVVAAIAWSSDKAAGEEEETAQTQVTPEVTEEPEEEEEETVIPEIEIVGEEEEEEETPEVLNTETKEEEEALPETLTGTESESEEPEEAPETPTPSGNYTVSINRTEVTASLNKYRELILSVNETLPSGVTVTGVTWTAADPSIVRTETVDGIGRAWGTKVGTTTVTGVLTLSDGQSFTASCEVSVVERKEETTPTPANGYVLTESSTRLYSASELQGLSDTQLWYARNEIYARHGRKFNNPTLQAYFDSQSWYNGTIEPENFDYFSLSSTERKNIETIQTVEAGR